MQNSQLVGGLHDHLASRFMSEGNIIGWVMVWLLGLAVLYRVIRTAVAHGIADADEKRRRSARPN
ncbi:hypothetical protein Adu01nite_61930 [Paractinoplanes durhamensis]|uniref:Uncharacterized protein n=1 Tax=Paractinoplanes durhamensis TaxID=113563 RepID=A0ABQ3Z4T0_9ACTN|nr:hypothetical protein Adu01nite_61930 [Actinoplanes durhamensis]